MQSYVGLDVSLEKTWVCVVDDTGSVLKEGAVASEPEAICKFMKQHAIDVHRVGLETGPTSTWLWRELIAGGLP